MIDFAVIPTALLFIAEAIPNTLFMAFVSLFFGILLGSVIALIRIRSKNVIVNGFLTVFISFFRGVPSIVQLFIVYYSLPYLLAFTPHSSFTTPSTSLKTSEERSAPSTTGSTKQPSPWA